MISAVVWLGIGAWCVVAVPVCLVLGRMLRHLPQQPQPWTCPDTVDELYAELARR